MKYWRTPLDQGQLRISRGRVIVMEDRCKGCGFCVEYCPREVLRFSKAFNKKGYHFPEAVEKEKCVNCHFCEVLCPEFAIFSLETTEAA